ncbi:hypothetical protein ACI7CM_02225 [Xanthobacter sp. AM33]|uniref:hypothetical protein n=1 Tax=Xanthobacter sp. AM33 TaxID=3380644 RepID=UPI0039BF7145
MSAPAPVAQLTEADRILAAEYVLGTLDRDERQKVRARIAADPGFAGLVRLWERRLSPLHELAVPVTPPPSIWRVIVSDLRSPAPAAPARGLRKVPAAMEGAPRPLAGEVRPGRPPGRPPRGAAATVRRLFGFAFPARGAGEASPRPKRPQPPPLPVPTAQPVPAALRVPGGRSLGGAIQDAVAAGLLPPAPPPPEPPPSATPPERADRLPPPLKPVPPAPPRPRPPVEPLTPPPAFIFLEPDTPLAMDAPEKTAEAGDAPTVTDAPGPSSVAPPPVFVFIEPVAPPAPDAPETAPAPDVASDSAAPALAGASAPAAVAPPPAFVFLEPVTPPPADSPQDITGGEATPPPPEDQSVPASNALAADDAASLPSGSPELAAPAGVQAPAGADSAPAMEARAELAGLAASPQGMTEGPSLEDFEPESPPVEASDATTTAVPGAQGAPEASAPEGATSSPAAPEVVSSDARADEGPAAAPAGSGPAGSAPASPLAGSSAPEPSAGEPVAIEAPSADPAAGAKGEEAPPLPGWAAVVASGVVSALPDPDAGIVEAAPGVSVHLPRRRGFPWRAATLALLALLVGLGAFSAYREWFWPRDGQWVGVLQGEPLPAIAIRLDPDSGVVFVRSFAPAPPEGEINRLWLMMPGRPALLLGEFTAGMAGRAPALAGVGRNRLGSAEVVVTQEEQKPAAAPGPAAAAQPSGKVLYRGRLAPE